MERVSWRQGWDVAWCNFEAMMGSEMCAHRCAIVKPQILATASTITTTKAGATTSQHSN